ncbi:MAG: ATP-binding cassette domain-containing protein [Bacteroidales bacterium]
MIEFQQVCFTFDGKRVVDCFSQKINTGEHVALMGESGAGKSTIMKSLMGLALPSSGRIVVDDVELTASSVQKIRSKIAWVPQEIQLPYTYVREALTAPFELKVNQGKLFDEAKLYLLFEKVGLEKSLLDRRMQEISGGERQRVMLVLAILLDKKILLLDEPTSAIDTQTREKMIAFLKELSVTLFAVTHDDSFAATCDRTFYISKIRE